MITLTLKDSYSVQLLNYIDLSRDEAMDVLKMRNHPDVRRWMYSQDEISENEHFHFISLLKEDITKKYFLVKYEEEHLGVIYFTHIDKATSECEFGLFANLLNKQPGKGSLLLSSVIEYFLHYMDLNALSLEVFEKNNRAMALYQRFGFIETKVVRHNVFGNIVHMTLQKRNEL